MWASRISGNPWNFSCGVWFSETFLGQSGIGILRMSHPFSVPTIILIQLNYSQGNSNSLASIDLNAGYVGLKSFNMPIVGFFLTLNTFSGPLLALLVMLYHLQGDQNDRKVQSQTFLQTSTLCLIFPLSVYLAIATGFRNHLFVWTVFSPKLLYETFNFGLFHVIYSVLGVTWCHKSWKYAEKVNDGKAPREAHKKWGVTSSPSYLFQCAILSNVLFLIQVRDKLTLQF